MRRENGAFLDVPEVPPLNNDDDQISNANTEDVLISSRTSTETISTTKDKKPRKRSGPAIKLITGTTLVFLGVVTHIWTPFELAMDEMLRLRPGLPAYDWWKDPPEEVKLRVHIFNVTNSEEYMRNSSVKLNLKEIGPIVFLEKLYHTNCTFNENGTFSYTSTRKAIFLPEDNTIDLNQTIIIPNWALLGMASYFAQTSRFVKFGYNLLVRTVKPEPFIRVSLYNFLWNFTDPMMKAGQKIAPSMVPMTNLGILNKIYMNYSSRLTVFIGTRWGSQRFFTIDRFDGSEFLPHYGKKCGMKISGGSEGTAYHQFIAKNSSLKYWRVTFCKNAMLYYQNDTSKYGIKADRFVLDSRVYDRTKPAENDCFKGDPALPNGLLDVSKSQYGFPVASSFPHFLHGDPMLKSYVTGLEPDEVKHGSWVAVQPIVGIPLEGKARSQSNLVIKELKGFHHLPTRFSNTVIPMFWLEYHQVGLPWYIAGLIYVTVNIMPYVQRIISTAMVLIGTVLFYLVYKTKRRHLLANKEFVFETEVFLDNKQTNL